MQVAKNYIYDDYYKLKISSKKLDSGRYQVKFFATIKEDKEIYGYVLVDASETLKAVISRIKRRLNELDRGWEYQHFQLLGSRLTNSPSSVIVFE